MKYIKCVKNIVYKDNFFKDEKMAAVPIYDVDVIEEQSRSTLDGLKKRKDTHINLSIDTLITYTKKVIYLCEEIKKLKKKK